MALDVDITHGFGGFDLAVKHRFAAGGITAVFGRSGSGKSTLLRVIAGLEPGAVGCVTLDGEVWQDAASFVKPEARGVGMVFQDARLFGHLTVAVTFFLRPTSITIHYDSYMGRKPVDIYHFF